MGNIGENEPENSDQGGKKYTRVYAHALILSSKNEHGQNSMNNSNVFQKL